MEDQVRMCSVVGVRISVRWGMGKRNERKSGTFFTQEDCAAAMMHWTI
jgi:hypothetical protein